MLSFGVCLRCPNTKGFLSMGQSETCRKVAWLGFFIQKQKRACREGSFFPSLLHTAVSSLLHSIGKDKGQNRAKY